MGPGVRHMVHKPARLPLGSKSEPWRLSSTGQAAVVWFVLVDGILSRRRCQVSRYQHAHPAVMTRWCHRLSPALAFKFPPPFETPVVLLFWLTTLPSHHALKVSSHLSHQILSCTPVSKAMFLKFFRIFDWFRVLTNFEFSTSNIFANCSISN